MSGEAIFLLICVGFVLYGLIVLGLQKIGIIKVKPSKIPDRIPPEIQRQGAEATREMYRIKSGKAPNFISPHDEYYKKWIKEYYENQ